MSEENKVVGPFDGRTGEYLGKEPLTLGGVEQLIMYLKTTGRDALAEEYKEKWLPLAKEMRELKESKLLAHSAEEQELKMWRDLALALADAVRELAKKDD